MSSNIFSIASDFYENHPNNQPLFDGRQELLEKTKTIIQNSSFLSSRHKQKILLVIPFFGAKSLDSTINSFMRQNIRHLLRQIEKNENIKK